MGLIKKEVIIFLTIGKIKNGSPKRVSQSRFPTSWFLGLGNNITSYFLVTLLGLILNLMGLCLLQIHREVAFNKTSQVLSKWDPIVQKNRQAKQLVFPLEKEQAAFAPIEHVLGGWKVSTAKWNWTWKLMFCNVQISQLAVDVIGQMKPNSYLMSP